jgi:hypothetical protein
LRRQEKQTHSDVAEDRSEGRNEPLSDWNAIVDDDVSVFPRPGRACAGLLLSQVALAATFPFRNVVARKCCLRREYTASWFVA